MQRLEVSGVVRLIYRSLEVKGLNWLRPFAERLNLVSARVPSHFKRSYGILTVQFFLHKKWRQFPERSTFFFSACQRSLMSGDFTDSAQYCTVCVDRNTINTLCLVLQSPQKLWLDLCCTAEFVKLVTFYRSTAFRKPVLLPKSGEGIFNFQVNTSPSCWNDKIIT